MTILMPSQIQLIKIFSQYKFQHDAMLVRFVNNVLASIICINRNLGMLKGFKFGV